MRWTLLALLLASPAFAGGPAIVLPGDVLNPLSNALGPNGQHVFALEWVVQGSPPVQVEYRANGQVFSPLLLAPGWCANFPNRDQVRFVRARYTWEEFDQSLGRWGRFYADCATRPDLCPRVQLTGGTGSCPALNRIPAVPL